MKNIIKKKTNYTCFKWKFIIMNKEVSLILAVDERNGLWKNWDLAWRLSKDMKYFKDITTQTNNKENTNAVLMWRKTWDSIPSRFKPLPWRYNCILSKNTKEAETDNTKWYSSIDGCVEDLESNKNIEKIFIIWWAFFYNEILKYNYLKKIYITKVKWDFDCDVFFKWIPNSFKLTSQSEKVIEKDIEFVFEVWER